MDGNIAVSSKPGQGTTFSIDFIFDCITAAENGEKSASESGSEASLTGRHILLCEDHPLNQEIAKAILEEQYALVTIAEDGEAGVKAFNGSGIGYFDCILMDIHMPIMDGYEAARQIRGLNRSDAKTVPIFAMINMTVMGLWHGFDFYYILYGVYHGLLLSLTEIYQKKSKFYRRHKKDRSFIIVSTFITFNLVMFGLFIFSGRFTALLGIAGSAAAGTGAAPGHSVLLKYVYHWITGVSGS